MVAASFLSLNEFPERLILKEQEIPVCFSILGAFLSFSFYTLGTHFLYRLKISFFGRKFYNFLNKKWFFDKVYNEFINQSFLKFGYFLSYKAVDRGFIEMIGPFGLSRTVMKKSSLLSNLQTGSFYDYALWMFLGLVGVILAVEFWELFTFFLDPSLFIIFFIIVLFSFRNK